MKQVDDATRKEEPFVFKCFRTKKLIMTRKYGLITIAISGFVTPFIVALVEHIGGYWERGVYQSVIMLAICFFVFYRKAIKRIQELEKEIEQKS